MTWAAVAVGVVGAGASMYSANKASKAAKKQTSEMSNLYNAQANLTKGLTPYALDYYKKSREAYEPAAAYYSSLAGGDRAKIMSTLAPELQGIGSKYQSIIGASRELNPRGGASAAYNTDLGFRAGDEQQALLSSARSNAFGNLSKLAGVAGDLGAGAAGTATNAGAGAGNMLTSIGNLNALTAQQQQQAYSQVGNALADAFRDWQNRGGTSSPTASSWGGWGSNVTQGTGRP